VIIIRASGRRPFVSRLSNLPLTWIRSSLTTLTQRLFAASDTAVRQHGWQVSSTRCGFGRKYRDPRFDTLASCHDCHGRGITALRNQCPRCGGTGRVTVKPASEPPSNPQRGSA
jgi:hypothetical protein